MKKVEGEARYEVAKFLYAAGGNAVEHGKIVHEINKWSTVSMTRETYHSFMSEVRRILETDKKVTLYNVRGHGYKIASPVECARFTAQMTKRAVLMAERVSTRLFPIVDKRLFVSEFKTLYSDAERGVELAYQHGRKLLDQWSSNKILKEGGDNNGK